MIMRMKIRMSMLKNSLKMLLINNKMGKNQKYC
jgi:hypothetical protein